MQVTKRLARRHRVALTLGAALAWACSSPPRDANSSADSSVELDSAGVRIVEWGSPSDRWQVSDRPLMNSATISDGDANTLHGVTAVVPVDSTSALVAEAQPSRLLLLDFADNQTRVIARSGAGPGELTSILWAARRERVDGYLVFDPRQKRLSVLAADFSAAALVTPQSIAAGPGALPDIRGEVADGRLIATSPLLAKPTPGSSIVRQPLRVFALDSAGVPLDSLTTVLGDEALVIGGVVARPSFLKRTSLVVAASELHVADGEAFESRSYGTDGRLRRVVRASNRRREVPDSLLRRFRSMGEGVLPSTVRWPEVSHQLVDDSGRLWLGRHAVDGEPAEWFVSGGRGELIAVVSMPPGFRLLSVWRGLLFGVGVGALGEETVQVFGLRQP